MTPPLPPSDRTKQLNVRLSPDEIEEIRDCSEALGITTSDFVRHAVKKQLEEINAQREEEPSKSFLLEGAHMTLALKKWDVARATAKTPPKKKR